MNTPIANVMAYVDAADLFLKKNLKGLSEQLLVDRRIDHAGFFADLQLTDLRALLERLADVCPEHGSCAACKTPLCDPCGVGEFATCGHIDAQLLCDDCKYEHCADCRDDMRREVLVDRHFGAA